MSAHHGATRDGGMTTVNINDDNSQPPSTPPPAKGRSPRFMQWISFLVISSIVLGSSVSAIDNTEGTSSRNRSKSMDNWAVACAGITFGLTFMVVGLHLNPLTSLVVVGTLLEGAICVVLVAFWSALVAIISDSKKGLAMNEYGHVSNGNLYYFSWAGFVCSVTLLSSYLRSAFHVDVVGEIRHRSARLRTWTALLACSLVVMGAAANHFDTHCDEGSDTYRGITHCRRDKLGVALGVISSALSVCIVGMKLATARAPFLVEAAMSLLLFGCWSCGVAYITGQRGPGSGLNNLYYFTWGCFVCSVMLVASVVEDYTTAKSSRNSNNATEMTSPRRTDVPVQHLGDEHL